jgi:phage baseplate assembly protein W
MSTRVDNSIYSDLDNSLTKQRSLVLDMDSIYQSISNILNTTPQERLFLPEFGVNLNDLLFEPIDDITTYRIFDLIIRNITFWEPRVNLLRNQSFVKPDPDNRSYYVKLVFTVKGLADSSIQQYEGTLTPNMVAA